MNKASIYDFVRKFIPKWLVNFYQRKIFSGIILEYLQTIEQSDEIKEVVAFLQKNAPKLYPYKFPEEYRSYRVKVEYSKEKQRYYVVYEGKKLFFKKSFTKANAKRYFVSLLLDLDKRSPHSYFSDDKFIVDKGSIVADVGAAEGIWALKNIDVCEKVYIFECDEEWIETLKNTFEKYKNKVEIVPMKIGKANSEDATTMDTFFENKKIDFVKADIEGDEVNMLVGGVSTFSKKVSKTLICAYHNYADEVNIKKYLQNYGFTDISTTKGYMLNGISKSTIKSGRTREPYITRGLLQGKR